MSTIGASEIGLWVLQVLSRSYGDGVCDELFSGGGTDGFWDGADDVCRREPMVKTTSIRLGE